MCELIFTVSRNEGKALLAWMDSLWVFEGFLFKALGFVPVVFPPWKGFRVLLMQNYVFLTIDR